MVEELGKPLKVIRERRVATDVLAAALTDLLRRKVNMAAAEVEQWAKEVGGEHESSRRRRSSPLPRRRRRPQNRSAQER